MYETKEMFGKCPICDAIVSLDPQRNVLCDRCYQDDNRKGITETGDPNRRVIMPTQKDLVNGFSPFGRQELR